MRFKFIDEDATYSFKKVKKLEDYSEWHRQVCYAAGIVDKRYPVSGMRVWMPYGHKMMELIHNKFQEKIEANGGQRTFFPLIIPYEFAKKNKSWWEKFEVEGFHACTKDKKSKKFEGVGLLRPTGEPAMYPMLSTWIRSRKDLPVKIFQICQNYRDESVTMPLLRPREFWWNEYHCAFATKKEVDEESELHLKLVLELAEFVGVPVITVKKPDWEVFPGGEMSYENYVVMPDGRSVDASSINNLGQSYSKKFNVTFEDEKGEHYAWIVCTGMGPRWLAGVLGSYGDDKGLILPPSIAPIQVIITPITSNENAYANKILKKLIKAGIRAEVDDRDLSPGRKFHDWEIKGVPIRVEIGKNEFESKSLTIVERFTGNKSKIKDVKKIEKMLKSIQEAMYKKACKELNEKMVMIKDLNKLMPVLKESKVGKMYWCGEKKCYDKVMKTGEGEGLDAFGTSPKPANKEGKCVACSKKSRTILYCARTY